MARNLEIERAARMVAKLGDSLQVGGRVQGSYDRKLAHLIALCAEESYIVKAARVLVRRIEHVDAFPDAIDDEDLDLLHDEIARAGAPPYEVGTGTETEDDWVAPLRAELTQRNR